MRNIGYSPSDTGLSGIAKTVFTLSTCAVIALIFLNSAQYGEVSGSRSRVITDFINSVLSNAGLSAGITENTVRKTAHLLEYTLLGLLMTLALRSYTSRLSRFIVWPLFLGLLIPVLDETLQLAVPGRSGRLSDVWIDFSGTVTGIVTGLLFCHLFINRRGKYKSRRMR